ncbi:hypothetical protein J6590_107114 [Homalodisca vitripennis]|nr:hypothetical protein J6590_107114 [Homalodisca vitripennis]
MAIAELNFSVNHCAAGEQRNIYCHLEYRIVSKPWECRLIVASLPHRYDLPMNHTINEEVMLVNAHIEELAVKHNIQVLGFNKPEVLHRTRLAFNDERQMTPSQIDSGGSE